MNGIISALLNKKKYLASYFEGEKSKDVFDKSLLYSLESTAVLIKPESRDFKILNITDTHFADYDVRFFMAFPAIKTIKHLVKEYKPDLITVTGDMVCSKSTHYSVGRFERLMNSFKTPWAPVFGNHDNEGNCDKNYLADIMLKSPYCLFKKGDTSLGCGNYVINIAEKKNGSLNIVESLILMDSRREHFTKEQIEWYEYVCRGICDAGKKSVESTVFFHIPLAEYQYAFDAAWDGDNKCWRRGFGASGELNEKICCYRDKNGVPVNNGFFSAVKAAGTTKNIVCGHEHLNNFSVVYDGIRLTYALKVGEGSGWNSRLNGGTLISVGETGLTSMKHLFEKDGNISELKIF